MASTLLISFSLPLSFKFLYWGIAISTALFGITILQGWIYFHRNRDGWFLRLMVSFMILVDLLATGFIGAIGYYYFVENYGDPSALENLPKFYTMEPLLTFPTIFMTQLFFAARVRLLKRENWVGWVAPAVIVPTATASFVSGMMAAVMAYSHGDLSVFITAYMKIAITLHTSLSAVSDITATVFLTAWTVQGLKSCFTSTKEVVKNLLVYVVTRGFLVTAIQLATCIMYIVRPDDLYWTPFHFCMGRVYILTMLSILNSRVKRQEIDLAIRLAPHLTEASLKASGPLVFASRIPTDSMSINSSMV